MWEQIRHNQRSSAILVIVAAALLLGLGYFIGETIAPGAGLFGLGLAFLVWLIMSLTAFYAGPNIFLSLGGARKIEKSDHPQLWNVVEEMTIASGLGKMPDVYVVDDPSPNAFATGRNASQAAVAVTTGLLNICTRDELQGVVAHEIGHIRNRDVLYMIMIGVMVGAIVLIADVGLRMFFFSGGRSRRSRTSGSGGGQAQLIMLVVALALAILAPILAQLLYFACSRRREYLADAAAATYTRYPEGLATALEKIAGSQVKMERASRVMAPMYIQNPLRSAAALTSTHPPIEERVRILRTMAGGASFSDYEAGYRKVGHKRGILPASALQSSQKVVTRGPSDEDTKKNPRDRLRQTTDLLWKLNQYLFIPCVCGTTLKIPPQLKLNQVICPRCQRAHDVASAGRTKGSDHR